MSLNNNLHLFITDNPHEVPANRLRGTSTAIALRCISDAILNPHTRIRVRDHHGTAHADRDLKYKIRSIIRKLRLASFVEGSDHEGQWIVFNLYRDPTTCVGKQMEIE